MPPLLRASKSPLEPSMIPDRRILCFTSVGSTQNIAAAEPIGTVIVSDEQTAGQGRHGHTWHSPSGTGLYFSLVLPPTPLLTLALGVATVEAIAQTTGITCDIRWPNDLMLDNRKVAGILVQLVNRHAICGIGINVNHTEFPRELEGTSLRMHSQHLYDREILLQILLSEIDAIVQEDATTILRLFAHASSYVAGRRVTVAQPGGLITGTTAGLDPEGYLIVRKDDGTDTLVLAGGVRALSA